MTGSSFTSVKRCKGCIFWQPYNGEISNPVMRKLNAAPYSSRKPNACVLRLRTTDKKDDEGNVIQRPSFDPRDTAGPRYGHRTSPNATCKHYTPKRPPFRKPKPTTTVLTEQPAGDVGQAPAFSFDMPAEGVSRDVELI